MIELEQLLRTMVARKASDMHFGAGSPPQLRVDGSLVKLDLPILTAEDTQRLCYSALSDGQRAQFEKTEELDLSFELEKIARFRINLFRHRGKVGGAFRLIPARVSSFEELGLPPIVAELCKRPQGLVLATGPTGSGKSSTLAAMIDRINTDEHVHIITIEDPIEYVHEHKNALIHQREVGADTESFRNALRYILRQDPDVVLIGELRDHETIEAALTVAETGHLVFATVHTNSAMETIHRIVDVFPSHQQTQVRAQLALVLAGVLSQRLIPRIGGGRVLALEVLIPSPAIHNLIRENKVHQIYQQMQMGQQKSNMQTLNQNLAALYQRKLITFDDAIATAADTEELASLIQKSANKPSG